MAIQRSQDLPYPDAIEDGPVKEYLIRLRDALSIDSTQLAEDIETRLSETISGTPVAGQIATWTDANTLTGASDFLWTGDIQHINDTANTKMTAGVNINQGANDDEIVALKSSDVAHGITDIDETDTYGSVIKAAATTGGMAIRGLTEDKIGMLIQGFITTGDTVHSSSSIGAVTIDCYKKSGTGTTTLGDTENLVVFRNGTTARFAIVGNGEIYTNGSVGLSGVADLSLYESLTFTNGLLTGFVLI